MHDPGSISRHFYTTAVNIAVMSITTTEGVAKCLIVQRLCKLVQFVVVEFNNKGQAQVFFYNDKFYVRSNRRMEENGEYKE
jgi:hypothetical protein